MATQGLSAKLEILGDKITKKLEQINNDANRRGVLYSGITVPDKVEAVSRIIENEMPTILNDHNSKIDRAILLEFLGLQKDKLYESFKINSFSDKPYVKLERAFRNMSIIIDHSAKDRAANKTRETVRFWLPLVMSIIAIIVSIILGIFG